MLRSIFTKLHSGLIMSAMAVYWCSTIIGHKCITSVIREGDKVCSDGTGFIILELIPAYHRLIFTFITKPDVKNIR